MCIRDRRDPAVVLVVLERVQDFIGRIVAVETGEGIHDRDEPEHEERAEVPEDALAGPFDKAPCRERDERDDRTHNPEVALGVPPHDLGAVCHCRLNRHRCSFRPTLYTSISNVKIGDSRARDVKMVATTPVPSSVIENERHRACCTIATGRKCATTYCVCLAETRYI